MSAHPVPAAFWIVGSVMLAATAGYAMGRADREDAAAAREREKAGAVAPQFERG